MEIIAKTRSGVELPFDILKINDKITILINETKLYDQWKQKHASQFKRPEVKIVYDEKNNSITIPPIQSSNTTPTFRSLYTKEQLLELKEFPANYVKYLPSQVIAIFSDLSKDDELSPNLKIVKTNYQTTLKTLQDSYKEKNTGCPSCAIGKLNREFIPIIIKEMFSDEELDWMVNLLNILISVEDVNLSSTIDNQDLNSLYKSFVIEVETARADKNGCSNCKLNSIKNKYLTSINELVKTHNKQFKIKS